MLSSHCVLHFIVNKSHPVREFLGPERASSQGLWFLVIRIILKKEKQDYGNSLCGLSSFVSL